MIDCTEATGHEYSRHPVYGYICIHCGAALPDPPEDTPPQYLTPTDIKGDDDYE